MVKYCGFGFDIIYVLIKYFKIIDYSCMWVSINEGIWVSEWFIVFIIVKYYVG